MKLLQGRRMTIAGLRRLQFRAVMLRLRPLRLLELLDPPRGCWTRHHCVIGQEICFLVAKPAVGQQDAQLKEQQGSVAASVIGVGHIRHLTNRQPDARNCDDTCNSRSPLAAVRSIAASLLEWAGSRAQIAAQTGNLCEQETVSEILQTSILLIWTGQKTMVECCSLRCKQNHVRPVCWPAGMRACRHLPAVRSTLCSNAIAHHPSAQPAQTRSITISEGVLCS